MKNKSGITPLMQKVIVLPDEVETKTQGGIILPEDAQEKEQVATTRGILIAASPAAYAGYSEFPESVPKVGQRVIFTRYGGKVFEGTDGKQYRMIEDEDVFGAEQ